MVNDSAGLSIGIDMGTFNSAAAYAISERNVIMVNSLEGGGVYDKNFPSFVFFHPDEETITVGRSAKTQLTEYPDRVVWGVKRLIGLSYEKAKKDRELLRFQYPIQKGPGGSIAIKGGKRTYTPAEILTLIASKIKLDAQNRNINPLIKGQVTGATVSVPAYYDATRVHAIIEAVGQAGFDQLSTISEPTAAAHQYGLDIRDEAYILTFDMGAGTLDLTITLLANINGSIEQGEIAVSGHEVLGGIDIDELLYAEILAKYNLEKFEDSPHVISRLKQEIEATKMMLSVTDNAPLNLPEGRTVNYSRSDLERALEPLLERVRGPLRLVLNNADITPDDIEHILFVGGPTFMPCVRGIVFDELTNLGGDSVLIKKLQSHLNAQFPSVNPMECVARGAALKAGNFVSSRQQIDPNGYGITLPSMGLREYYCSVIEPNSSYPLRKAVVVYQNTPKAYFVPVSLVKKLEYIESGVETSKYLHLGDYDCFIDPGGQDPLIRVEMEIDPNKSLITTLTHVQTDESVKFEALDHLVGEEILLQEDDRPEPAEDDKSYKKASFRMDYNEIWTDVHLQKTKKIALQLLSSYGDVPGSDKMSVKENELRNLLSTNDKDNTRFIMRRIQEFLNLLSKEKRITEEELMYNLMMLREIVA